MPVDVGKTLRQALAKLTGEKQRIDRQIGAIEAALQAAGGRARGRPRGPGRTGGRASVRKTKRRRMSAAARKAIGARMKAYWAKRRGQGRKARSKKESTEK